MWIYSLQSHWHNLITMTLMELSGSLHETVTDLAIKDLTKIGSLPLVEL